MPFEAGVSVAFDESKFCINLHLLFRSEVLGFFGFDRVHAPLLYVFARLLLEEALGV